MVTRRSFLVALSGVGVVGFGGLVYTQLPGEKVLTGDPVIRYGEETCARCRMVISNAKFAAAWRQPDGTEEHFDDIGCMVLLNRDRHLSVDVTFWVHDFESEQWLDASKCTYEISTEINSPMGYGIAAKIKTELTEANLAPKDEVTIVEWFALQHAMKDEK